MVTSVQDASVPEAGPQQTRRRWRLRLTPSRRLDVLLAGLLALSTFFVHNVSYILSAPFWNDEAWVVISTKLPLHDLRRVSSATPVGWTLLLRTFFVGGEQRYRLLPLLFSALSVVAAYLLVRDVPWRSIWIARMAAVLAGGAALLAPSALGRNDLKQYTADACITVILLLTVSRLEQNWTRRRAIALGVTAAVGFLFSAVAVFAAAAAFASVIAVLLIRREWRRAIESTVLGAVTALVLGVTFLVLYRPGLPPALNNYWKSYYLPIQRGWGPASHYLNVRSHQMATYLGMGPLGVAIPLVLAGVVTLIWHRRPAVGLMAPILLAEMILLGAMKKYPLFDERTSHFLTISFAVLAAVGVAGVCALLSRIHLGVAVLGAAVAATLFIQNVQSDIGGRTIPAEDLRAPAHYIDAHRRPNDVIVVSELSSWGFAYYWPHGKPARRSDSANLQGFVVVFPDQPKILVALDRTGPSVADTISQAIVLAAKEGAGSRIWVVHQHVSTFEKKAFDNAYRAHGLDPQQVIPGSLELLATAGH
jgi:hypothetical protein